jgi:uncharacterized membrane protein YbhN (UPF0104 family)
MGQLIKRGLLVLVKVGVLLVAVGWVLTRARLDDTLVHAPGAGQTTATTSEAPRGAASVTDGAAPQAFPDASEANPLVVLRIERDQPTGAAAYVVRSADGRQHVLPAAVVDGPGARYQVLPGFRRLLRELNWGLAGAALALTGIPVLLMAIRWWFLLRTGGVRLPFRSVLRLHFLGMFFNTFMPGGTGGDVVKAFAISRQTEHSVEAISMILVDRALGMLALLLIPALIVLCRADLGLKLGQGLGLYLGGFAVASALYFSARVRRLIRWDRLALRLPRVLVRLDAAVYGLRRRPRALLVALSLSLATQFFGILATYLGGLALGIERAGLGDYFLFVPIALVVNALPISFGGLGLMEGAFLKLFAGAGLASPAQGFALGLLVRLLMICWALPGGLCALGRFRPAAADAHAAAPEAKPALALIATE